MVSTYKRKSDRQKWSAESMKQAIEKVFTGVMGLRKASDAYNVPKTTLKRRVQFYRRNQDISKATVKKMGRFNTIFTKQQEEELATYVKDMESRFFGLTTKDLRSLAYDLAEKNKLKHIFDKGTKMAGRYWLESFLRRNPDLSVRKPEATSAARASGFNKVAVRKFFSLLLEIIDTYKLTPDKIFNVDETGMTTVPKSLPKIIGRKGKKQVGLLTSAERGQLVTVVFCLSAEGSYMPPLFVFPRKRFKPELMNNAPRGSSAECHESGWIQKDIFTKWFQKFITFSRASKNTPVLLLLDGHASHTKNLDVINLARANGVHIISFPPHCTHRLQPLDVGFLKPLSTYYSDAAKQWLRTNPGRIITQFQIAELVNKAFERSATIPIAHNAFRATGIWPPNPDIFTDADFLAADTTEIDENEQVAQQIDEPQPCCSKSLSSANVVPDAAAREEISDSDDEPLANLRQSSNQDSPSARSFLISPAQIMPIPKNKQTKRVTKRRGKTAIITSSPYRQELQEIQNKGNQVKRRLDVDESRGKGIS
ncbi:hypothetical protein NQ317_011924 [Molorchus minor]|uniref:HTH CENPB-type domain-containing protein n=1 Tax=Molorchus minor TaxID=1323400 RepID=A0ABQ9JDA9_9CUCU|nr:hypothetical protein NQ317_011924 [Molorchus minor]